MEDDLKHFVNWRRPQIFLKLKTTSNIFVMEDDFKYICKWMRTSNDKWSHPIWSASIAWPELVFIYFTKMSSFQIIVFTKYIFFLANKKQTVNANCHISSLFYISSSIFNFLQEYKECLRAGFSPLLCIIWTCKRGKCGK